MPRPIVNLRNRSLGPIEDFYKEMDHLLRNFFDSEEGRTGVVDQFTPSANLVETEKQFEVSLDLPGIDPSDVNVEVLDDQLSIVGERKSETKENGKTYHRIERRYGSFRRLMPLPSQVDESRITADYKDGVLRVVLPKSEKAKPTRIEVKKA